MSGHIGRIQPLRGDDQGAEHLSSDLYGSFMRNHLKHYGYYTGSNEKYKLFWNLKDYVPPEERDDMPIDVMALQNVDKKIQNLGDKCLVQQDETDGDDVRTTQVEFQSADGGRRIARLREPRQLYSITTRDMGLEEPARWPLEMEVIKTRIQHIYAPCQEGNAFYRSQGTEDSLAILSTEAGRVVYDYNPIMGLFLARSRSGPSQCLSDVSAKLTSPSDATLVFESRFESGNLKKAVQIGDYEYELWLRNDLYTDRHTQWYYFRVSNTRANIPYRFTIVNFTKPDSLYNCGMRPLLYSEKEALCKRIGWRRTGCDIKYYKTNISYETETYVGDKTEMPYYALTFTFRFPYNYDTCYFAHCYPYTFTDLQEYLLHCISDPAIAEICKVRVLCRTLAGNPVHLVTITEHVRGGESQTDKRAVILTARVHPGESNASWMMKGMLDFLCGSSKAAKWLRRKLIFKIVPMLNPDGVIVGNYRCSLVGRDLNRNYKITFKDSFPEIWHLKDLVRRLQREREIVCFCDLHGHSRKQNVFIYGCENRYDAERRLKERIFPYMLGTNCQDMFSFEGCNFKIQKKKEGTGRVVMWAMGIMNSYTMESTFCGSTIGNKNGVQFNSTDLEKMGRTFCTTLIEYLSSDPAKFEQIYSELEARVRANILAKLRKEEAREAARLGIDLAAETSPFADLFESENESSDTASDSSDDSGANDLPPHLQNALKKKRKQKLKKRRKSAAASIGSRTASTSSNMGTSDNRSKPSIPSQSSVDSGSPNTIESQLHRVNQLLVSFGMNTNSGVSPGLLLPPLCTPPCSKKNSTSRSRSEASQQDERFNSSSAKLNHRQSIQIPLSCSTNSESTRQITEATEQQSSKASTSAAASNIPVSVLNLEPKNIGGRSSSNTSTVTAASPANNELSGSFDSIKTSSATPNTGSPTSTGAPSASYILKEAKQSPARRCLQRARSYQVLSALQTNGKKAHNPSELSPANPKAGASPLQEQVKSQRQLKFSDRTMSQLGFPEIEKLGLLPSDKFANFDPKVSFNFKSDILAKDSGSNQKQETKTPISTTEAMTANQTSVHQNQVCHAAGNDNCAEPCITNQESSELGAGATELAVEQNNDAAKLLPLRQLLSTILPDTMKSVESICDSDDCEVVEQPEQVNRLRRKSDGTALRKYRKPLLRTNSWIDPFPKEPEAKNDSDDKTQNEILTDLIIKELPDSLQDNQVLRDKIDTSETPSQPGDIARPVMQLVPKESSKPACRSASISNPAPSNTESKDTCTALSGTLSPPDSQTTSGKTATGLSPKSSIKHANRIKRVQKLSDSSSQSPGSASRSPAVKRSDRLKGATKPGDRSPKPFQSSPVTIRRVESQPQNLYSGPKSPSINRKTERTSYSNSPLIVRKTDFQNDNDSLMDRLHPYTATSHLTDWSHSQGNKVSASRSNNDQSRLTNRSTDERRPPRNVPSATKVYESADSLENRTSGPYNLQATTPKLRRVFSARGPRQRQSDLQVSVPAVSLIMSDTQQSAPGSPVSQNQPQVLVRRRPALLRGYMAKRT